MTIRSMTIGAAVALVACVVGHAQSRVDRAFQATGTSCEQVTWSDEILAQYPNIASACREVMERDGKYYVKFQGEVRRVRDRGREVTVNFRGGDQLTLNPPEDMKVYLDNRPTPVANLQPGDELNFYVPEDQLTAQFYAGETPTGSPQEAPIVSPAPERVAAAPQQEQTPPAGSELPATASVVPLLGLGGMLLVGLGGVLTVRRKLSRSS